MGMSQEKEGKEIIKRETLIIPGIDRGVIPMGIFPEDLSGVMTKYYENLLPTKWEKIGKLGGIVTFLITFFVLTTLIGLLYAMLLYGLEINPSSFCGNMCYASPPEWWERVNGLWGVICDKFQ